MMKKLFIIALTTFTTLLLLESCNKDRNQGECISFTTAQVTHVVGPNNIAVNQEIDLRVDFYLSNGCGIFQGVEAASSGNTTIISLKATYKGCICTEVLLGGRINYRFKADQAGVYYLKFLQPNNTYFIDTITVN